MKQCDVGYLRAEAERLYEEVISEYADVPYIRAQDRVLEALLKQPEAEMAGRAAHRRSRRKIQAGIARRRSTLGQVAEARLDDWHNLAVGKPAPEIKGVDVHGKPLTLSDYRGKVVALVFWGTWCGPCMRQIPREKALVERMKDRPFAMLGVNVRDAAAAARKVMEAQGITWPNWHDGEAGEGPIAKLYHVRGISDRLCPRRPGQDPLEERRTVMNSTSSSRSWWPSRRPPGTDAESVWSGFGISLLNLRWSANLSEVHREFRQALTIFR